MTDNTFITSGQRTGKFSLHTSPSHPVALCGGLSCFWFFCIFHGYCKYMCANSCFQRDDSQPVRLVFFYPVDSQECISESRVQQLLCHRSQSEWISRLLCQLCPIVLGFLNLKFHFVIKEMIFLTSCPSCSIHRF